MCLAAQSCATLCNPMDNSPPGSSGHGDSPGKNTGVGCHALLQGIFSPQGWIPGLPPCRWILSGLSHEGVIWAHKTLPHLLPPGHIHQSPVLSLHTAFPAGLPPTLAVLRLAPTLPPGPIKYSPAFTLLKTQTGGSSVSRLVRQREVSTFWHALLNPYRLSSSYR